MGIYQGNIPLSGGIGQTPYQIAAENGYTGTEDQFNAFLAFAESDLDGKAASDHTHTPGSIGAAAVDMSNVDTTALAAQIQSLMDAGSISAGAKVVTGTYTGDGNESKTISLGFTPKVVILVEQYYGSEFYNSDSSGSNYGPLIVTTERNPTKQGATRGAIAEIISGGFKAYYYNANYTGQGYSYANASEQIYYYIAIA